MPLAAEGFTFDRRCTRRQPGEKGCEHKSRFPSRAQAARSIHGIRRAEAAGRIARSASDAGPLEAYYCPGHGCWHIGHRPRSVVP